VLYARIGDADAFRQTVQRDFFSPKFVDEIKKKFVGEIKGEFVSEIKDKFIAYILGDIKREINGEINREITGEINAELAGQFTHHRVLDLRSACTGQGRAAALCTSRSKKCA
jgi:hypothetical protein